MLFIPSRHYRNIVGKLLKMHEKNLKGLKSRSGRQLLKMPPDVYLLSLVSRLEEESYVPLVLSNC